MYGSRANVWSWTWRPNATISTLLRTARCTSWARARPPRPWPGPLKRSWANASPRGSSWSNTATPRPWSGCKPWNRATRFPTSRAWPGRRPCCSWPARPTPPPWSSPWFPAAARRCRQRPYATPSTVGKPLLTLEDKQSVTRALLRCGATINEINCIRKHLSGLKGGRFLQHIAPARSVNFILSDVIGDDLSSIASGLTAPDPMTFGDALGIIEKYKIAGEISEPVLATLRRGHEGRIPETLKHDAPEAALTTNILIGTNATALAAAGEMAESLGYALVCLTSRITGDAGEVAKMAGRRGGGHGHGRDAGQEAVLHPVGRRTHRSCQGHGQGRSQPGDGPRLFDRDRKNGPTSSATWRFWPRPRTATTDPRTRRGAFASLDVLAEAARAGVSTRAFLRNNDSYHSLRRHWPTVQDRPDQHQRLRPAHHSGPSLTQSARPRPRPTGWRALAHHTAQGLFCACGSA